MTNSAGCGRFFAHYERLNFTPSFGILLPLFGLTSPPIAVAGNGVRPETKKLTDELRFTSIRINNFVWQLGEFVTQIPLTPLGKVDRKALRTPYWINETREVS